MMNELRTDPLGYGLGVALLCVTVTGSVKVRRDAVQSSVTDGEEQCVHGVLHKVQHCALLRELRSPWLRSDNLQS